MFPFEDFEIEHFLEFLNQGLLDEFLEEIFRLFHFLPPEIQFNLILYVREKFRDTFSIKLIKEVFGVTEKDAYTLLQGEGKICPIVLTNLKEVFVARALVIFPTTKIITNLEHLKSKLQIIKNLTQGSFAVFFEKSFQGDSFMLPLAVYLNVKRVPENLLFTGKLNSKGDILEVEHLEIKKRAVSEAGFRLVTPLQVKHFETIRAFLDKETWDIPFYVTSSGEEEFESFLRDLSIERTIGQMELFRGLEVFYQLKRENFYLVTGQLGEEKDWKESAENFYRKIYLIKHKLPGAKTFHLAIRGPSALAFGLGILFSHFDPFVFYHYQTIEGVCKYHPVAVPTPREIKELKEKKELVKFEFEKGETDDIAVILNFSHHELIADVKAYFESLRKKPNFLYIEGVTKGNIPLEKFPQVARETATVIQEIRKSLSFNEYHFFFSCPVAIAFMVGLAFGHYVDGCIYNYQKEKDLYKPVLSLKDLRLIREKEFSHIS